MDELAKSGMRFRRQRRRHFLATAMADYVKKVFLAPAPPKPAPVAAAAPMVKDSDGDGVPTTATSARTRPKA